MRSPLEIDWDTFPASWRKELIVNHVYPQITSLDFLPFDCNYINYHEFFVDRCFDDLKLENLDTVIDIGANVGLFAKYMYTINAKKVILVEANPYLQESIEYHLDGDLSKSTIYRLCGTRSDGRVNIFNILWGSDSPGRRLLFLEHLISI
jgi:hypothetical protein